VKLGREVKIVVFSGWKVVVGIAVGLLAAGCQTGTPKERTRIRQEKDYVIVNVSDGAAPSESQRLTGGAAGSDAWEFAG
jgi:hypothetical protein